MPSESHFIESFESRSLFSGVPLMPLPAPRPLAPPAFWSTATAVPAATPAGFDPGAIAVDRIAAGDPASTNPTTTTATDLTPAAATSAVASAPAVAAPRLPVLWTSPGAAEFSPLATTWSAAPSYAAPPIAAVLAAAGNSAATMQSGFGGTASMPVRLAEETWTIAAHAAETGSTDLASIATSPFSAVASAEQAGSVFGSLSHAAAVTSPAAAAAACWVVQEIEQGVNLVARDAELLLAATGLEHAAVIDALAAVFAAGAFSAWWLDGLNDGSAIVADDPERRAFCDRFIRFGAAAN